MNGLRVAIRLKNSQEPRERPRAGVGVDTGEKYVVVIILITVAAILNAFGDVSVNSS